MFVVQVFSARRRSPTVAVLRSCKHVPLKRMVVRLIGVKGLEGRCNDVVFVPAARRAPAARTLVYWGGDVQDYPEVMQAHRDNRMYLKWNLESTARALARAFPAHHVVVVRPSRIEYKSFSCFDNFVPSNDAGVPDHAPTHGALLHLQRLLQEVSNRVRNIPEEELLACLDASPPEDIDIEDLHASKDGHSDGASAGLPPESSHEPDGGLWWRPRLALHEARLALCGFSKGCAVLNQLCHEFHYTHSLTPTDSHATKFITQIDTMYWLDGGHAGGRNTWLTSRCLLETLARLDVEIYVHVTPYQVRDEARPWIGREEKAFTAMLKKLGANIHRYLHEASGTPVSLHMHFGVVGHLRRPPGAPDADD